MKLKVNTVFTSMLIKRHDRVEKIEKDLFSMVKNAIHYKKRSFYHPEIEIQISTKPQPSVTGSLEIKIGFFVGRMTCSLFTVKYSNNEQSCASVVMYVEDGR